MPSVKVGKAPNARDALDHKTKRFRVASQLLEYATTHPTSVFGRTLTNLRVASDECLDGKGLQLLGVTSTFDGEGRTTIAANLAFSMASAGRRVLLVDASPQGKSLSKLLALDDQPGLTDCISNRADNAANLIWHHAETKAAFLPFGTVRSPMRSSGRTRWDSCSRT